MKLPAELLLLSFVHLTSSAPLQQRSADFLSLRGLTRLTIDYSNPDSVTRPDKFFHESTFDPHYDGRFAEEELPLETRAFHLRLLVKTYMETMDRIGIQTWIMHGCLLGWWWNGKIMPWDSDVDVMMDERSIKQLGNWWNMTVHHFTARDLGLAQSTAQPGAKEGGFEEEVMRRKRMLQDDTLKAGKKYLLEVNPNYTNTSTRDKHNVIDARWIDTSTGLYIDITTVHVAPIPSLHASHTPEDESDIELYTKDQHAYSNGQLFPLRKTTFESIDVKVPFAFEELLLEEYGPEALTDTYFNGYGFDPEKQEWALAEPTQQQSLALAERESHKIAGKKSWRKGGKKAGSQRTRKPVDEGKSAQGIGDAETRYEIQAGRGGDVHVVPGSSNDY
ncbi:LicD family-domain-containing protein [Pyrenochaeta sp. MPI-SDFR-AT-0127]|nr:LicD family-domain-containing protein [Pyrenochaeta sp. MPI-SDFR-AT-0127]